MAKKSLISQSLLLAGVFILASTAMAQDSDDEKPQAGFVRILNAATITMKEPWRAGLNLSFKDQPLAMDMRGGESGGYRQIMFRGKDTVDLTATQTNQKVGFVPASFQKDCFYTLLVTGRISDSGFNLKPLVVKDFPIPDEKKRPGSALVRFFNAVDLFIVSIKLDDNEPWSIAPMTFQENYLQPGEHKVKLLFNHRGSLQEINSRLILSPGSMFTVVVLVSPESPDRPTLKSWNDSEQMKSILESLAPPVAELNP